MKAIILAGGSGTRLRPYTTVLPKPLMPVGEFPIAEIVVRQLAYYGFTKITFAVGYLHQLLQAYFGDGSNWNVEIDYLREDHPLGTAGPLTALENIDEPFLVMNGDILTDLNLHDFFQHHLDRNDLLTIATHHKEVTINLGVLDIDNEGRVVDYHEKPIFPYNVSMGIYVFHPEVIPLIPATTKFDFPDLVKLLLAHKHTVRTYRTEALWLDIGRTEDYLAATEVFEQNRNRLLPDNLRTRQQVS